MYKTICFDNNFSNILDTNGRMLAGQYLFLKSRNPFLKIGAILAFFKIVGETSLSTQLLKKSQI